MEDKDVFCVSCGEAIVINLEMIGEVLECPACHTRLLLDEADENDSAENDIEWSPEVDAADANRVFGVSSADAPVATLRAEGTPESPAPAKSARIQRRFPVFGFITFSATAALGWLFYQELQRSELLERRLELLENKVVMLDRNLVEPSKASSQIADIQYYLDELDETVSQIATVLRLQNATSLQNEYTVQTTQKNLLRQESEFGKLAMKIALVELSVADKSRMAKEAFELSVRHRKEADSASKPIRQRIRELEEQKNKLFAQYRAGSIARYPQGVVSKGRATKIMQDYEKRAAPLLAQIQQEIAKIREAIEIEEAKIEALYEQP
ncbi:MAG: hypothetical protein EOP85_02470 [Verrucomicrobiaceae bacterium]|nr:MAG: hypothetical protein EOP85_02470 [Verrucomicrobiaceae bacterium]